MTNSLLPGILHELPTEIATALLSDEKYAEIWNKLTPIQRNEWICWITIVKKEATRVQHIQQLLEQLLEGKRKPCCWPGCPHRNPQSAKWFK
ncbi:MAG: YdeI/OmpD-associated family protein [Chitinophagaceae bacterium]